MLWNYSLILLEAGAPPTKIDEAPPIADVDGAGVIYPYYVQLYHTDNTSARLHICEDLYMQSSENYGSVSKCDLESLNKALLVSRKSRETALVSVTRRSLIAVQFRGTNLKGL